jgi:hypothetical protein
MHIPTITSVTRLIPVFGLFLLISLTSGCATRALMSSDSYDKAEPSNQQFHVGGMQVQDIEQTYQLAIQQQTDAIN